jgi:subtilisin family serine protease
MNPFKRKKQPGPILIVRVSNHENQPINDASVTAESKNVRKKLPLFNQKGVYRAEKIPPGEYRIVVEAEGFGRDERDVRVTRGKNEEQFILGREGLPFYYRGKIRVPFEPMDDLIALVMSEPVGAEQLDEQRSFVRTLATGQGLEVRETGENIARNGIHVLRIPAQIPAERRRELIEVFRRRPDVKEVAPLLKLFEHNATLLTNELIIRFREKVTDNDIQRMARNYGFEVQHRFAPLGNVYRVALEAPPSYELIDIFNRIAEEEIVEYAEPNLIHTVEEDAVTPTDFLYPEQWDHQLIRTPEAWQILQNLNADRTFGNTEIVIAVVDSGVDAQHPEFNGTLSNGSNKIYQLFDFVQMVANNNILPSDHGTCCASAVTAATNNLSAVAGVNEGVSGVAGNCRLIGVRRPVGVAEDRYAEIYLWLAGFDQENMPENFPPLLSPAADIITNSFGYSVGQPASQLMRDTFDTLTDDGRGGNGVLLFFSAGNINQRLDDTDHRPWGMYERCLSVAASTLANDGVSEIKSEYSSFGTDIEFCAPSNSWRNFPNAPLDAHNPPAGYGAFTATTMNNNSPNNHPTVGRPTVQATLNNPANAGATILTVNTTAGFAVNQSILVGVPGNAGTEGHRITNVNAGTGQLTINRPLFNNHVAGELVHGSQADYRSNFGGTSYATPVAAGIAALILTLAPSLNWTRVRDIMRETAVKIDPDNTDPNGQWQDEEGRTANDPNYAGPHFSEFYGYGRLDAEAALQSILRGCLAAIIELIRRIFRRD